MITMLHICNSKRVMKIYIWACILCWFQQEEYRIEIITYVITTWIENRYGMLETFSSWYSLAAMRFYSCGFQASYTFISVSFWLKSRNYTSPNIYFALLPMSNILIIWTPYVTRKFLDLHHTTYIKTQTPGLYMHGLRYTSPLPVILMALVLCFYTV